MRMFPPRPRVMLGSCATTVIRRVAGSGVVPSPGGCFPALSISASRSKRTSRGEYPFSVRHGQLSKPQCRWSIGQRSCDRRSGTAMAISPWARMRQRASRAHDTIFFRTMAPTAPQRHFVVRDAVKLHHLDWGNQGRHPIVLVHGSRLHAHVWNHFSRRFRARYHIIALDQRGHGESGWGAPDGYQRENFYEDLRAVVDARGLSRFTLIGHSLGGRVSMLYASRHPQMLERLVLVDITPGR